MIVVNIINPRCEEEITELEMLLERPLSEFEKDLYEFAHKKGYKKALDMKENHP